MKNILLIFILLTSSLWCHDIPNENIWIQNTTITYTISTTIGELIVDTTVTVIAKINETRTRIILTIETVTQTELVLKSYPITSLTGWNIVDNGSISKPSNWSIKLNDNRIYQGSNIYNNPVTASELSKLGTYIISPIVLQDYFKVIIEALDNDGKGVMFQYRNDSSYFRLSWDNERKYTRLVRNKSGIWELIHETNTAPTLYSKITIEIQLPQVDLTDVLSSNAIEIKINGILWHTLLTAFTSIQPVAFYTWGEQGIYFGDIEYKSTGLVTSVKTTQVTETYTVEVDTTITLSYPFNPDYQEPNWSSYTIIGYHYQTISEPVTYDVTIEEYWKNIFKMNQRGEWILIQKWKEMFRASPDDLL